MLTMGPHRLIRLQKGQDMVELDSISSYASTPVFNRLAPSPKANSTYASEFRLAKQSASPACWHFWATATMGGIVRDLYVFPFNKCN